MKASFHQHSLLHQRRDERIRTALEKEDPAHATRTGDSPDATEERAFTAEELSDRFHVSTKTISRWRKHGLLGRPMVFEGRKRLGFLDSEVQRFVAANSQRVRRGQQFSHLSQQERDWIIGLARDLVSAGSCRTDVVQNVARLTGRSAETVRYTIRAFDQRFPERAILSQLRGRLSEQDKRDIYAQYRRGVSTESLGRQYSRQPAYVHRLIRGMQLGRVTSLPLDYIPSVEFDAPDAAERILVPLPAAGTQRGPSGLGACPRTWPACTKSRC